MIKNFKHKGLKLFFDTGSTVGIPPEQAKKIKLRLAVLDSAEKIEDIDLMGYKLHSLKGTRQGTWSISVTGNWRITFQFIDGNVYVTNFEDYH